MKGRVRYSEQLVAGLPWPQTAAPSHTSAVTLHIQLQLAGAGSVLGTGKSREKHGVTSDRKILLTITDFPSGTWFATGKPVSTCAGMEDEPVKCNKHFTQQFPDKKYCYPKPMHRWEEPAGFLGGDESRVWVSYLFLLKLFQDFSPKMG